MEFDIVGNVVMSANRRGGKGELVGLWKLLEDV